MNTCCQSLILPVNAEDIHTGFPQRHWYCTSNTCTHKKWQKLYEERLSNAANLWPPHPEKLLNIITDIRALPADQMLIFMMNNFILFYCPDPSFGLPPLWLSLKNNSFTSFQDFKKWDCIYLHSLCLSLISSSCSFTCVSIPALLMSTCINLQFCISPHT